MTLRTRFVDQMKAAMKAGDVARTSTLRMIIAKLKDADIASRPKGIDQIPHEEIIALLRGMVKSRREALELYIRGRRPELAAKEEAEIAVIESFLPPQMDVEAMEQAVADAVEQTGATSLKDMGKVMATLKTNCAESVDMAVVAPLVKARLGG